MSNKIWLLLAIFLVTICGVNAAATTTITLPTASGSVGGIVNISVDTTDLLPRYAWVYVLSSSTGNSSYVEMNKTTDGTGIVNSTTTATIGLSFDSSLVEDSNDYTFYVIAGNSSTNYTDTNTGITIHNTVPGANTVYVTVDSTTMYLSSLINNKNSTSCWIVFSGNNPGSSTYTLVESTTDNNATYSEQIRVATGTYSYTPYCTDRTNETTGNAGSFSVITSAGQSGLGGFLVTSGIGEVISGSEISVEGARTAGEQMTWKIVSGLLGLVIGIFGGIILPIPFIPKQFLVPVTAVLFAVLGWIIGGLI